MTLWQTQEPEALPVSRAAFGSLFVRWLVELANDARADGVVIEATTDAPARALLVAGQPLREPIAQYGPFVMNTQQEIYQALTDYREGRLGAGVS